MIFINSSQEQNLEIACWRRKYLFNLDDVIRLEASSNYTWVYTVNRKPLLVAKVLASYTNDLQQNGFVRVHRSHLVNKKFINCINNSGVITLVDNSKIEVS